MTACDGIRYIFKYKLFFDIGLTVCGHGGQETAFVTVDRRLWLAVLGINSKSNGDGRG